MNICGESYRLNAERRLDFLVTGQPDFLAADSEPVADQPRAAATRGMIARSNGPT